MKIKNIIMMSFFAFIQQLFSQNITEKQLFSEDISNINSLEKGIQQAEMVVHYLLQEGYSPSKVFLYGKKDMATQI